MMILFNSKERSLDDFKVLGLVFCAQYWEGQCSMMIIWSRRIDAGFEFVKVWDMAESGIVEFKIAM